MQVTLTAGSVFRLSDFRDVIIRDGQKNRLKCECLEDDWLSYPNPTKNRVRVDASGGAMQCKLMRDTHSIPFYRGHTVAAYDGIPASEFMQCGGDA